MVNRIWIPSPNFSSSRSRNQVLVVHTSEGATTFRSLGNFLAQKSSGVSYHCGFDDTTATDIGEYVKPANKSWSALSANDWGEHGCCCTPSGASSGWSRDIWLSKDRMLTACAQWLVEESGRYGIPLVKINAAQIGSGVKGVCGHGDVAAAGAGGGHTDPGPNFPWDVVLAKAGGAAPAPAPPPASGGVAPPWPGRYLQYPPVMSGADVHQWQGQMSHRGWTISVDGAYGPQSKDVCTSFQREKGLAVDGVVGPQTWSAAWTAPIT